MSRRLLIVAAALVAAAFIATESLQAAELKKLVVKCIEKAEATPDDVFLEFVCDGRPIAFAKDAQKGTSRENTVELSNGAALTLEAATLQALKFEKSLTIRIKDKDITRDEPIGVMELAPGDISNTYVAKGKDVGSYEYHVDYETTK